MNGVSVHGRSIATTNMPIFNSRVEIVWFNPFPRNAVRHRDQPEPLNG